MLFEHPKLLVLTFFPVFVTCAMRVNESEKYSNYAHSIVGLGELLRIESELIDQLEKYEEKLVEKLNLMRIVINDLREEHKKSMSDPILYLSNPLNSFALLRRTHDDWVTWHSFVQQLEAKPQIDFIEELKVKLPTEKDVKDAVLAIIRIKETYEMSAEEMANGLLYGKQYDARLSALDCYVIGKHLETELKHNASISWYNVSTKLFSAYDDIMSDVLDFHEAHVWNAISECLTQLDLYYRARDIQKHALSLKPDDAKIIDFNHTLEWFITHEELCRGEIHHKWQLKCRYNHTTTPFLKLAPLKLEEIAYDPYIVLYHDIIYDHEVEELKNMALPKFSRGMVGLGVIDPQRTAQMARLPINSNKLLARIQRRIDDMTGFDWIGAKPLQVINYGIGGHYFSHIDYYNVTLNPHMAEEHGDRIAAILIYMNDVEAGGSTAFPKIGTAIKPRKGSAILWYHLDNAGNGNIKSMHASCPVLFGSKWIAVKLAHFWPQMFIKPCYK